MRIIFTHFFGEEIEHYTTYLFAGNLIFSFFRESTTGGMNSLMSNAHIFTKINVPKYMFLLTKNVSSIINFGLTLLVFFVFAAIDGVQFTWKFLTLLYPICCLTIFNIGIGLILSALFVFFRDISYLYDVFTMLLMYMSAIFYTVDGYPAAIQRLFLCNPVYCVIKYVRLVVLEAKISVGGVPSAAVVLRGTGNAGGRVDLQEEEPRVPLLRVRGKKNADHTGRGRVYSLYHWAISRTLA